MTLNFKVQEREGCTMRTYAFPLDPVSSSGCYDTQLAVEIIRRFHKEMAKQLAGEKGVRFYVETNSNGSEIFGEVAQSVELPLFERKMLEYWQQALQRTLTSFLDTAYEIDAFHQVMKDARK